MFCIVVRAHRRIGDKLHIQQIENLKEYYRGSIVDSRLFCRPGPPFRYSLRPTHVWLLRTSRSQVAWSQTYNSYSNIWTVWDARAKTSGTFTTAKPRRRAGEHAVLSSSCKSTTPSKFSKVTGRLIYIVGNVTGGNDRLGRDMTWRLPLVGQSVSSQSIGVWFTEGPSLNPAHMLTLPTHWRYCRGSVSSQQCSRVSDTLLQWTPN